LKASRLVAAVVGSILLNIGLFGFLPLMTYLRGQAERGGVTREKHDNLVALPVIQKKKEPPKNLEPPSPVDKKTPEPGKSLARQRFVMDLGPGGGGGGAAGAPVSSGDLKQVSYEEGEVDVEARPISQTPPKRPKKAEAAGVSGLVRCLLTIGEDGKVADVQFLEVPPGNYGFEEAVREAVSTWRYQPAKVGGVAVRLKIEQPFKF
jgi:protein TonB